MMSATYFQMVQQNVIYLNIEKKQVWNKVSMTGESKECLLYYTSDFL